MNCLLAVNWGFGVWMASEETCQVWTYIRDGREHLESGWKGLLQFLSFKWNILDLMSSTLLVVFNPLFHILAPHLTCFGKALSFCVALEALLASVKVP